MPRSNPRPAREFSVRPLFPLFLVLFAGAPAVAADAMVAVLPLKVSGEGVSAQARETVEETIRSIAGDRLVPKGYLVLTGDTTLAVLADNAIEPGKACEASCALQAARELKATLFISGSITFLEGAYVVFVRLFDDTGKQLASTPLDGVTVRDVRAAFEKQSPSFFEKAPAIGSAAGVVAQPAPQPVAAAPGRDPGAVQLRLHSEEEGWRFVAPQDELICVLPCTEWYWAGSGRLVRRGGGTSALDPESASLPASALTPGALLDATVVRDRKTVGEALLSASMSAALWAGMVGILVLADGGKSDVAWGRVAGIAAGVGGGIGLVIYAGISMPARVELSPATPGAPSTP